MNTRDSDQWIPRRLRLRWPRTERQTVLLRALLWTSVCTCLATGSVSVLGLHPAPAVALGLMMAALLTANGPGQRRLFGLLSVLCGLTIYGLFTNQLSGWTGGSASFPSGPVFGSTLNAATITAAAGLTVGIASRQSQPRHWMEMTMWGAIAAAGGMHIEQAMMDYLPQTWVLLPLQCLSVALSSSVLLIADACVVVEATRPPPPSTLENVLGRTYQQPSIRAHQIDQEVEARCPDPLTRDDLGEVAVWIFRLQSTLQHIDATLDELNDTTLQQRLINLGKEIDTAKDHFVLERKQATLNHLRGLKRHKTTLQNERIRTTTLVDYAAAFLEEAYTGLTVAGLHPGHHTPAGLPDVLERLRQHELDHAATRKTHRELALNSL